MPLKPYKKMLEKYLGLIKANFNTYEIINQKQDKKAIKQYYLTNHLSYLIFHNKQGFMHLGITRNGRYKVEDLLEPLKIINSYIQKMKAKRVLELGSGNGSNSAYLAQLNPKTVFYAIDLVKRPLTKFIKIPNFIQKLDNYHNLEKYKNESIDLVFAIETICHSTKKDVVLREVHKKLKEGGLFIIFDGYSNRSENKLTENETLAKKLTEKSLAVENFEPVQKFEATIKRSRLSLVKKEDLSQFVLPTLERFENLAILFYKSHILTKILKGALPPKLVYNSIAGLLLPTIIKNNIACYYLHILKKN